MSAASLDFMLFANCAGMPTNLFFPELTRGGLEARRVCSGCQVRSDCRDYAIRERIEHGIFGGLDEVERRRFARKKSVA